MSGWTLTPEERYELDQWAAALAEVDHLDDADPRSEPRACPAGWSVLRRRADETTCDLCSEPVRIGTGYHDPTRTIGRHVRCPGPEET